MGVQCRESRFKRVRPGFPALTVRFSWNIQTRRPSLPLLAEFDMRDSSFLEGTMSWAKEKRTSLAPYLHREVREATASSRCRTG